MVVVGISVVGVCLMLSIFVIFIFTEGCSYAPLFFAFFK